MSAHLSGGVQFVYSDTSTTGTQVLSGAFQVLGADTHCNGMRVGAGGEQIIYDDAIGIAIRPTSPLYIPEKPEMIAVSPAAAISKRAHCPLGYRL